MISRAMAKVVATLIPLIFSMTLLLLAVAKAEEPRESLSFAFDFNGDERPTDLIYRNDAHFPTDSPYLRLTRTGPSGNALPESIGQVTHRSNNVQFTVGPEWELDFETTLKFIITPQNGNPADGLTFFFHPVGTPTTIPVDSTGSGLGIFSARDELNTKTFAVEFDTYFNGEWDPTNRHVGIDIGSKRSSVTTEMGDALVGQNVTAHISYVSATKRITVSVTAGSQTYQFNYIYDLSTFFVNPIANLYVVGLSAATGGSVAVHDIISWHYSSRFVYHGPNNANIQQVV